MLPRVKIIKLHSKLPRQIFTRKTCSLLPSAQNHEPRHLSKLLSLLISLAPLWCWLLVLCASVPATLSLVCVPFWIRPATLASQGTTTTDLLTLVIQALFSSHILTPQKSFTMQRSISVTTSLSHSTPKLHSLCTSAITFQHLSPVLYLLKLSTSLFHGALDVWWILFLTPLSLEVLQKTPDAHWRPLRSPVCPVQTGYLVYMPLQWPPKNIFSNTY